MFYAIDMLWLNGTDAVAIRMMRAGMTVGQLQPFDLTRIAEGLVGQWRGFTNKSTGEECRSIQKGQINISKIVPFC